MEKVLFPLGSKMLTMWLLSMLVRLMGFNTGGHVTHRDGDKRTPYVVRPHTHGSVGGGLYVTAIVHVFRQRLHFSSHSHSFTSVSAALLFIVLSATHWAECSRVTFYIKGAKLAADSRGKKAFYHNSLTNLPFFLPEGLITLVFWPLQQVHQCKVLLLHAWFVHKGC